MVPTHILICIFALGVGIKSFAQDNPATVLPADTVAEPKPESVPEPKFDIKFEPLGDLRYRISQSKEDIDETRTFHQLRARLGVRANVEKDLTLTFRLATATSAISSNQTLGDSISPGMPRRSFGIDQAFSEFRFGEGFKFWAGRTANPFWAPAKNQLIYDGDLNFEGLALKWEPKWGEAFPFVNLGGFIVNESYDKPYDTVDLGILGAQFGYSVHGFTFHVGQQAFVNIQDRNIVGLETGAKIDVYQGSAYNVYRGNSVYPSDPLCLVGCNYLFTNKYLITTGGFEYKTKFSNIELMLFGDTIHNTKAPVLNKGYEAGIFLKHERVSVQLAQIFKEADATVGAFTDSDTNGGGTDASGTRAILGYQLSPKSQILLNTFKATRGLDTVKRDFSWTQLDLIASF